MTITAFSGPLVSFGSNPAPNEYNPDRGPSLFDQGYALMDPRAPFTYQPGQKEGATTVGWLGGCFHLLNQVPSALAANNIAASQSPGAGAINLVSTSAAGITVGTSITNSLTGATVTGLLAIDGAMTPLRMGDPLSSIFLWDPTKAIARNVRITSGSTDTGITFTVRGYDVYGYPMTETITGASAGNAASGKKAFKYIASVSHTGSVAGTLTIGTGDVFGFPLRVDLVGSAVVWWADTLATSATTPFGTASAFVFADTTTATATTGDVRGTVYVGTASPSDASRRLQIFASVLASNLTSTSGLLGVDQFAG